MLHGVEAWVSSCGFCLLIPGIEGGEWSLSVVVL